MLLRFDPGGDFSTVGEGGEAMSSLTRLHSAKPKETAIKAVKIYLLIKYLKTP
jgi:hypothetical protein